MTKIDISIRRKRRKSSTADPKKAPIDSHPQAEHFPRRLGDVLLNFFDLGQYWNGSSYQDIEFLLQPALLNVIGSIGITSANSVTTYAELRDTILALIADVGYPAFRKLEFTEAEKYGLDIYIGENFSFDGTKYLPAARAASRNIVLDESTLIGPNPRWTANGLKIPRGTRTFQIWSHLAFLSPKSADTRMKITSSPDYSAAAVPFSFNTNADVYLMPRLTVEYGLASTSTPGDMYLLNGFYTTIPRSFFLERNYDWFHLFDPGGGNGTIFEYTVATTDTNSSSAATDLLTFLKSRPEARVWSRPANGLVTLASFPPTADYIAVYSADGARIPGTLTPNAVGGTIRVPTGALVAIIRKGGHTFYAWHDWDEFPAAGIPANAINGFNFGGSWS